MNLNNNFNNSISKKEEDDIEAGDKSILAKLSELKITANQVKADTKFSGLLRDEISDLVSKSQVRQDSSQELNSSKQNLNKPLTFFSFMNKLIIPLVVVAIVASGTGYWYASKNDPALLGVEGNELLSGKYAVTEVDENSFGDLDKINIIEDTGRGGNSSAPTENNNSTASGSSSASSESDKLIAPGEPYPCEGDCGGAIYYKFKYVGKELGGLSNAQPVLKRSKPEQPASLISRLIKMFSFGLVDLSHFENARMQSVSFLSLYVLYFNN